MSIFIKLYEKILVMGQIWLTDYNLPTGVADKRFSASELGGLLILFLHRSLPSSPKQLL